MKIGVCIPSGDDCKVDWAFSMIAATQHLARTRRDFNICFINEKQTLLQVGRHRLVLMAMQLKCDYILWIDTDMQFSYDCIHRLIDSGKDIIGLQALMRAAPFASNTYDFEDKQVLYPEGTVEVKYIGTGFLLTKLSVFEKIGEPYFRVDYQHDRMPRWRGEDLDFCDRARAAGFKIYCHGDLSKNLYHIGIKKYGWEVKND